MKKELLRIENILAEEQGLKTLDDFFMNLYEGELLGVFANNATDKRHFIELITGKIIFERGRICYRSKPLSMLEYQAVRRHKIALIQSQSKLVDDLTVASNIFVVRDGFKQHVIHQGIIEHQATQLMHELNVDLMADGYVHQLNTYEKAVVEVVKAYGRGADIIILEDLSRFLTDKEIQKLQELMLQIISVGVSVILVDSYAQVLENVSNRVLVLKNGRNLWTFEGSEFSEEQLDRLFWQGRSQWKLESALAAHQEKSGVLEFSEVSSKNLDRLSFKLEKGRHLSIFDREGQGVDGILDILKGDERHYQGCIRLNGKALNTRNPWQSVQKRIGFVSENPAETMLFNNLSAIDNLTYTAMNKIGNVWFRKRYDQSVIKDYQSFFSEDALYRHTDELTTIDRHRLAYLKWHLYNPSILVCCKPFSSVDMALRETTLELMTALLDKGVSLLILSSNYEEVRMLGELLDITSKECPLSPKE